MTTKKLSALQTLYRAINTLQWRGAVTIDDRGMVRRAGE